MNCPRCKCLSGRHQPAIYLTETGSWEDTGWTVCLTDGCPCRIDRHPLDSH